ncbi:hypothetical protein VTN96DRAFT_1267 [Rasamsonia emersonii]
MRNRASRVYDLATSIGITRKLLSPSPVTVSVCGHPSGSKGRVVHPGRRMTHAALPVALRSSSTYPAPGGLGGRHTATDPQRRLSTHRRHRAWRKGGHRANARHWASAPGGAPPPVLAGDAVGPKRRLVPENKKTWRTSRSSRQWPHDDSVTLAVPVFPFPPAAIDGSSGRPVVDTAGSGK